MRDTIVTTTFQTTAFIITGDESTLGEMFSRHDDDDACGHGANDAH